MSDQTLRKHVREFHPRVKMRRSNDELAREHAHDHWLFGSISHRHEGVNLGPGHRPPGWYTGADVVPVERSEP